MANKGFGAKEINVIGIAGTPAIDSFDNLILGANTVFVEGEVIAQRFYGDGSGLTNIGGGGGGGGGESYWRAHPMGPMVGIATLSAVGIGILAEDINAVNVESKLTISGGDITLLGDNNSLNFYSSTVNTDVNTGIRFYEGTTDIQPRMAIDYNGTSAIPATGQIEIKATNNDLANGYFTYAAINRYGHVGIGSTLPKHALDLIGNVSIVGVSTFAGITTITGQTLFSKQLNVSGVTTFIGNVFSTGILQVEQVQETYNPYSTTINSGATVNLDCSSGTTFYITSTVGGNWTANLTNFSIGTNCVTNITLMIIQGATAYIPTALQIGGVSQTINWQGGSVPTGNNSKRDAIAFTIFYTGSAYNVFGQIVTFG